MSIEVMTLVWSRKLGSPSKKSVLAVMADAASPDGSRVFLSKPTIAKKCEVSKDTVARCIKSFLSDGLILEVGKHKISNGYVPVYDLNLSAIRKLKSIDFDAEIDTVQNAPRSTVHPDTPAPCTLTPPHSAPQTVLEPSLNLDDDKSAIDLIMDAIGNAANPKSHEMAIAKVPLAWTMGENPCNLQLDLIPVLKRICSQAPPQSISSWNYFRIAVFKARDLRMSIDKNKNPKAQNVQQRNSPNSISAIGQRRRERRGALLEDIEAQLERDV